MESFLKGNLEALKRYNPQCFAWLSDQSVSNAVLASKIFRNSRGMLDWRISAAKGMFDAIEPEALYGRWAVDQYRDGDATVIVGCNLGYGLNRVLARTPMTHKVLVVEPRADILSACLAQTDYRPFLRKKRLFFLPPNKEVLREAASHLDLHYLFGKIRVLSDVPSRQLGPEYAQWTDEWKALVDSLSCDLTTLRQQQTVMVENELGNFERARRDGCLLSLRGQAEGLPAVMLGAGPSLDKFGPLLAKNRGNALYVCSLQVLPILQKYGLKPHLCLAIDYTKSMERVYETLDRTWVEDIPFIYSCKVQPSVVKAYPGPTLPLWTSGGIGSNIPPHLEFVLSTGKGVGTAMVRFLLWCGIERLLLVGHDFAWSANRTHAEGHVSGNCRFVFDPKNHKTLVNREGRTIYSTLAYVTAKRELEDELERSKVSAFNLYDGGAVIRGARVVDWHAVTEKRLLECDPTRMQSFLKALQRARHPRPWPRFRARGPMWVRSLGAVEKRLKRLFKRASRNQEEIHEVLNQILFFFKQDPFYQPCLYNEIFDVAGLTYGRVTYGLREWTECRSILNRARKRIRRVDACLTCKPETA